MTYYAVVTFGSPATPVRSYYRSEALARLAAAAAKGTGSCSTAHVLACETRKLAISADISVTRPGERTVWSA